MIEPEAAPAAVTPPAGSPFAVDTLPFRRLLDRAMVWVRRTARPLLLPFAVVMGLYSAVATLASILYTREVASWGEGGPADPVFSCGVFLVLIALGLGYFWFLAWMAAVAVDAVAGREPSVTGRAAFLLRPRSLGTLLLVGILCSMAYLCCFFPALVVVPLLALSLPVLVEEGRSGWSAVQRASRLARYNPSGQVLSHPMFKIFVFLVVSWLVSTGLSAAVQLPVSLAQQWEIFRQLGQEAAAPAPPPVLYRWYHVPLAFVSGAITAAAGLYMGFGLALLFFDLRKRKEGGDLEAAVRRLDERRGLAP